MSTEIDLPFPPSRWGGEVEGSKVRNTCPVDGPLSWFMLSLAYFPKLLSLVETFNLLEIKQIFELFKAGKYDEGKINWLKNVAKIPTKGNDFYGSESEQFFEPIARTPLAMIKWQKKCNNSDCQRQTIKKKTNLLLKKNKDSLQMRIENAANSFEESCSHCDQHQTVTSSLTELPPLIFIPFDYINAGDEIQRIICLKGVTFILLLVTLYQQHNEHFLAVFRLNDNGWIEYDGLEVNPMKMIQFPKIKITNIRNLLYARADIPNDYQVFPSELIKSAGEALESSIVTEKKDIQNQCCDISEESVPKNSEEKSFKSSGK